MPVILAQLLVWSASIMAVLALWYVATLVLELVLGNKLVSDRLHEFMPKAILAMELVTFVLGLVFVLWISAPAIASFVL